MLNSQNQKYIVSGVIGALFLALAFFAGIYVGGRAEGATNGFFSGSDATQPAGVDFSPVWKAWQVLDEKYVPASTTEAVSDQDRVWGMVQGLANALGDPYTVFLPPQDNEVFEEDIRGNFEGVGMEIGIEDNILTVIAPLKDTPAFRAGIKSGDKILRIDEEETRGMTIDEAVQRIRGERGTTIELTVLREGADETMKIEVTRDVITIPTVNTDPEEGAGLREDGVYVIQLYNFSAVSQGLFRQALRDFIESGTDKLVIDLRGNPGGYLQAAVDMASWFLPVGKPVVIEDYGGEERQVHRSRGYDVFNDNLKLVILVDRGSASASEILAGALRAHDEATLIGQTTFGKGSVQELVPITEDTSLKVTVARWLTPDGTSISQNGITPDIEVEFDPEAYENGVDTQLERAARFLITGE